MWLLLWRSMQLAGKLVCPAACAEGTPFEDCACACPSLSDAALANMTLERALKDLVLGEPARDVSEQDHTQTLAPRA